MRDYTTVGPAPCDEACAQLGEPDYDGRARHDCRRFIQAIEAKLGPPPKGAALRIKGFPHEFGTYYDVVCEFDDGNELAAEYAYACEAMAPSTWSDTARQDWRASILEQPPTLAELAVTSGAWAVQR